SDTIFKETGIRISPHTIKKYLTSQGVYEAARSGAQPRYQAYAGEMKELRSQGLSLQQISDTIFERTSIRIGTATIKNYLIGSGIQTPIERAHKVKKETVQQMIELYLLGNNIKEIARQCGCSVKTVKKYLKEKKEVIQAKQIQAAFYKVIKCYIFRIQEKEHLTIMQLLQGISGILSRKGESIEDAVRECAFGLSKEDIRNLVMTGTKDPNEIKLFLKGQRKYRNKKKKYPMTQKEEYERLMKRKQQFDAVIEMLIEMLKRKEGLSDDEAIARIAAKFEIDANVVRESAERIGKRESRGEEKPVGQGDTLGQGVTAEQGAAR
ncbi:MAG: helix-turn-helix domain-containing protein, partial [Firmicutes bacterium]|nr:helix-turn-helix domain-containing protein [Bacillota bacterium]